jgi:hypothetical protein
MVDKKAFLKAFMITLVFSLGFLTSNIYANLNVEQPSNISTSNSPYTDQVASPSDWVNEGQIGVYSKNVILDIKDAQWAQFTDTHSMEPVLSSRANAIEVVPKNVDQIKVGDIVSYESEYADGFIVHRVIQKSSDEQGVYFIMKGDNNDAQDPGRVRFNQIKRVVVAIVY